VNKALRSLARSAFHAVGGTLATRVRNRNGVRILMYHRFKMASRLEEQCAHLQKYYRPISLTEVGWWLRKKGDIPQGAVVFTVDDGYRDFFVNAYPVVSAFKIPALVYLATDMIDQRTCLWVDWVRLLCGDEVKNRLKKVPNAERLHYLDQLPKGGAVPEENTPLQWDEIRLMAKEGIEFGAHTRSHPILARLETREQVWEEIAGSKARIERELGAAVLHFCYPNGNVGDFTDETVDVVKECGYLTAVTAGKGVNFAGADPFRLRRIHQEPWIPAVRFAQTVAGLPD
jgi:peptidoglycan/xylan/chitin deacetylase (PgdA/CDA1 family)